MSRCTALVGGRDCRNQVRWVGAFSRSKTAEKYYYCTLHKNAHQRWPNGIQVWTSSGSPAQRDAT